MELTLSLASDGLDFLLVAAFTAVVLFVAAGVVLRLRASARPRRTVDAGREITGRDDHASRDVDAPGPHGLQQ